jgi:hypothetical protein
MADVVTLFPKPPNGKRLIPRWEDLKTKDQYAQAIEQAFKLGYEAGTVKERHQL